MYIYANFIFLLRENDLGEVETSWLCSVKFYNQRCRNIVFTLLVSFFVRLKASFLNAKKGVSFQIR